MEVPESTRWSRAFLRIAWLRKRQVRDEVYAPMLRNALRALEEERLPDPPDNWFHNTVLIRSAMPGSGSAATERYLRTFAAGLELLGEPAEQAGFNQSFLTEMQAFLEALLGYCERFLDYFKDMNQVKPALPLSEVHFATLNLLRTRTLRANALYDFYDETVRGDIETGRAQKQTAESILDQMLVHYAVLAKALRELEQKHPLTLARIGLPAEQLADLSQEEGAEWDDPW